MEMKFILLLLGCVIGIGIWILIILLQCKKTSIYEEYDEDSGMSKFFCRTCLCELIPGSLYCYSCGREVDDNFYIFDKNNMPRTYLTFISDEYKDYRKRFLNAEIEKMYQCSKVDEEKLCDYYKELLEIATDSLTMYQNDLAVAYKEISEYKELLANGD